MPKVLVPLAPGVEEIEAVAVIDVLRRAGVEVVAAGTTTGAIEASRGVKLFPDRSLDGLRASDFDMIVVPGGRNGVANLKKDPRVTRLLQEASRTGKYTTAICAGPTVLAAAGLLQGKRATSHPTARGELVGAEVSDERVVVDGRVVTSQAPGTAIEFALKLVELLCGKAKAEEVNRSVLGN